MSSSIPKIEDIEDDESSVSGINIPASLGQAKNIMSEKREDSDYYQTLSLSQQKPIRQRNVPKGGAPKLSLTQIRDLLKKKNLNYGTVGANSS